FRLTAPKKGGLRICRDLSCNLSGSGKMLRELKSLNSEHVAVEGISCLGRCDRDTAACVAEVGSEHECYYLQRSTNDLKAIVAAALKGTPAAPDHDRDFSYAGDGVMIDPYKGDSPDYRGVRAALEARDASLRRAMEYLKTTAGSSPGMLERFRIAAIRQLRVDFEIDPGIREAARCW